MTANPILEAIAFVAGGFLATALLVDLLRVLLEGLAAIVALVAWALGPLWRALPSWAQAPFRAIGAALAMLAAIALLRQLGLHRVPTDARGDRLGILDDEVIGR